MCSGQTEDLLTCRTDAGGDSMRGRKNEILDYVRRICWKGCMRRRKKNGGLTCPVAFGSEEYCLVLATDTIWLSISMPTSRTCRLDVKQAVELKSSWRRFYVGLEANARQRKAPTIYKVLLGYRFHYCPQHHHPIPVELRPFPCIKPFMAHTLMFAASICRSWRH